MSDPTPEEVQAMFNDPNFPVLPPACGVPHPEKEGVFCQKPVPCYAFHLLNQWDARNGSQPITWTNEVMPPKRESQPSKAKKIADKVDENVKGDDWELPDGDRDGDTYAAEFDYERLNSQAKRVYDVIRGGAWWTLAGIAEITGDPEASISARLRDLRKAKFGALNIERRSQERATGLFEYRLVQ